MDLSIDHKLIKHLAKVARLELTEFEMELFISQLKIILEAFKEIDSVETDEVKPSFHPLNLYNVFREDKAKSWEWNPLENAGHIEGKYIRGPRIT